MRRCTAATAGGELGLSARTIRRHIAMTRDDYLIGAAARRERAVALADAGLGSAAIAQVLGCSPGAARKLVARARRDRAD